MAKSTFLTKVTLGLLWIFEVSGCVRQPAAPPDFPVAQFPPAPQGVIAVLNSGFINITWRFNDSVAVRSFRIYRQEGRAGERRLIGTSAEKTYRDVEVLASLREYGYSVSAVSPRGYEGPRSEVYVTAFEFEEAPDSILLLTPTLLETFPITVQLAWTISTINSDFTAYQVYRANGASVTLNDTPVVIIPERNQLSYVDSGLKANELYSYRVFVFTRGGRFSASNTVSVRTPAYTPPQAVTLAPPMVLDSTSLRLTWSSNTDKHFASYRLLRSSRSPVTIHDSLRTIIQEAGVTTHEEAGLVSGATYFYRVAVYDQSGVAALSNEVSGTPR
ncbi:MAG: fibronectin type III domain-containing protein [bacterium]